MRIGVNKRLVQAPRSGIPTFINETYLRLPKLDHNNSYFFFGSGVKSNFLNVLFYENISLLNNCNDVKVDILHGPAHTLPWYKPARIKYLLTVHDLSFLLVPKMSGLLFKYVYSIWLRRSLSLADHIVTDSNSTKRDLQRIYLVPENKISTIYLGVDANFKPTPKTKFDTPYLLTVATHPIRKNLEILAKAFVEINKSRHINLKVVGNFSDECKEIIRSANLQQKVEHFTNLPQDKLIKLYQGAALFVYPSLYEGFGLPVLEAMACGVPTLCSDNSSLPEVQPDANQRFDVSSLSDLVLKINNLLNVSKTDLNEIRSKNVNWANKFTWDKTAFEYKRVINSLKLI